MLAKQEKKTPPGRRNHGADGRASRVAALRELRYEERRGNDAPWKAWKTQKPNASFPRFPPGLEIRQKTKAPDSHISTAPTMGLYLQERIAK